VSAEPQGLEGEPSFVARYWNVYTKPIENEDRFISELERRFPRSEWIDNLEPPAASVSSSLVEASRKGSPGALAFDYAVMGSSKVHGAALEKWLKKVPANAKIICAKPRSRKDGQPMNTEALLVELRPKTVVVDEREDLYAGKAEDVALEEALRQANTIVLIGTGKKVTYARTWIKRISQTSKYNNDRQHILHDVPFDVVEVDVS